MPCIITLMAIFIFFITLFIIQYLLLVLIDGEFLDTICFWFDFILTKLFGNIDPIFCHQFWIFLHKFWLFLHKLWIFRSVFWIFLANFNLEMRKTSIYIYVFLPFVSNFHYFIQFVYIYCLKFWCIKATILKEKQFFLEKSKKSRVKNWSNKNIGFFI